MKKWINVALLLLTAFVFNGCNGVRSTSPFAPDCSIYKPPQDINPVCISGGG